VFNLAIFLLINLDRAKAALPPSGITVWGNKTLPIKNTINEFTTFVFEDLVKDPSPLINLVLALSPPPEVPTPDDGWI
jgi:hypothetical protein